jgi:hypothetical protein
VTVTDDELATSLRALVATLAPHQTWDAPTIIAAGRRRRFLRRAGAVVAVSVGALAAALVLPTALSRQGPVPPADTSSGTAHVVRLGPGLVAVVGVEGPDGDVLMGTVAGTVGRIQHGHMGPAGPTGPPELVLEGRYVTQSVVLNTETELGDALLGAGLVDAITGELGSGAAVDDPSRSVVVLAGTLPADLADGHVLFYSPSGVTGADGRVTHVVALPTFSVPTSVDTTAAARAPWFTLEVRGPEMDQLQVVTGRLLFASADGSIITPVCEIPGSGECAASGAPGLAAEVRKAIGR